MSLSPAPLVIVNPRASRLHDPDRRQRIVTSVVAAVEARTGHPPIVADTTLEHAREALAAAAAPGATTPLVAVVGGDGTIRESATALAGTGVPIAIVPAGTGNVFAAALGVPRSTSAAVRLIEDGSQRSVDIGQAAWGPVVDGVPGTAAGSHAFVVACGLGFDARVMAAATTDMKRRLKFGAYVLATAQTAATLRATSLRIEADGDELDTRGLVVLIANCGQIIPGLVGPRHPIDPDDGLLDIFVITATGLFDGIAGAAEVLLAGGARRTGRPWSVRLRAASVRVIADPPEPVQVDGDPHEADWLSATAVPGAITVLRP
jgi:diacylglycerol kinase family enzyme